MDLFDVLTDTDKQLIERYIIKYGYTTPMNLRQVLRPWAKAKRTLYKALGNKLRVSVPIEIATDDQIVTYQLREVYKPYNLTGIPYDWEKEELESNNHPFILSLLKTFYFCEDELLKNYYDRLSSGINDLERLLHYASVKRGQTYRDIHIYSYSGDKQLKIPEGTKLMKAIQKILKFHNFKDMESFDKWRNDISNINTKKHIKTNMVFSIHPIDYMTMSDNNCDWSSCMSWADGSYSNGTVEMLNSNNAVVCYLESNSKKFMLDNFKIPNKSWRCLYFVHKKILCSGKPYPYYNEKVTLKGLDILHELVNKNLNWKYQYINQRYYDLMPIHDSGYLRENYIPKKGHIYLCTYPAMYNDMTCDHSTAYWCYRNWVDKGLKISVSGLATCMCCGKPLSTRTQIANNWHCSSYDESGDEDQYCRGHHKYCRDCETKYWICKTKEVNPHINQYQINKYWGYRGDIRSDYCSKIDLIHSYYYLPQDKVFLSKNQFSYYIKDTAEAVYKTKEIENISYNTYDKKYYYDTLNSDSAYSRKSGTIQMTVAPQLILSHYVYKYKEEDFIKVTEENIEQFVTDCMSVQN